MKIALIGMMGSGKTKLGQMLAAHRGIDFVDLDQFIETRSQRKISELFRDFGEEGFRNLEADALRTLAEANTSLVLGCGGGVVMRASNRSLLKEQFNTVWLDVPIPELLRRLSHERVHRPLLFSDTWEIDLKNIFRQRKALYRQTALIHYVWQKGQSIEESAGIIEALIDERDERALSQR